MKQRIDQLAVSPREAADMIGVSLRTLQKYIRAQQLPARKLGRRTVIEIRHVKAFLSEDRPPAPIPSGQSLPTEDG